MGFVWVLTGCGASLDGTGATAVKPTPSALTGTVRGGSQPISGSQVYLYAVSTSQDAGPASSLLVSPGYVTTGNDGSFSLAGDFTCPAGAYVYLLAKGGNPGLAAGTNNAEIALAAGLGLCSAITSSTHVSLNEVTTVATAYSLAAYASSETNIGANNAVANTLGSAFANIPELINTGTGYALTTNANGGIVPQATIDSLANALAACVSSDGTGTLCPSLMTAANVTGANGTPVDTFQAALNIAQNPTVNVQGIFNLPGPGSPFQPSLSGKPADWTVAVTYTGTAAPPPVYYVSISPGSATIYQEGTQTFTATVSGSSSVSGFSYQWYTTANAGLMTDPSATGQAGQTSYCSANAQSTYVPNTATPVTTSEFDSVEVSVFTGSGCPSSNFIGSIATRISVIPDVSATAIPAFTTAPYSGTVVLPTGIRLTPDQVSVLTSVTSTTPLPTGAFTVTEYADGEQIVMVLSPAGNPMLLGWMDSNHPTVSASTTAEVLAFFTLGGHLMLNESDRNEMIAGIPQLSAFPALVQAISTEIAANPDAFSTTDANVQAAVAAFYTAVTGLTPAVKQPAGSGIPYLSRPRGGTAKPDSVIPTPSSSTTQSGVSFTGQDPTQAYATNAFRRRAHVFVLRQNDITLGNPNQTTNYDPTIAVTDFDLAPTVGLTGGVTGAVSDIFKAYFGTQPTAYAPINSDPFSIPVTSGFDETSYQVLTVGPGDSGAPYPVDLTNAQQAVLVSTSVNGLVNDALVPFISNVSFGSGSMADASSAPTGAAAAFKSAFIGSLESQVLALTQGITGEQEKIVAGDYAGAANDLLWGMGAQQFQNLVSAAITTAVGQSGFNIVSASSALQKFNFVMKVAGAGLQGFDTSVYAAQLEQSDNVDQWTLLSVATKVTLTSTTPTINGLGNSGLTTTVLGVSNTNGYSYLWTITPDVSTNSTIGTLEFSTGATQLAPTTYCSSSATSTYVNTYSAVSALTAAQTDDITVTVFSGANCTATNAAPQIGNPATVSITTNPGPSVTISPVSSAIMPGGQVALTATVHNVSSVKGYGYMWTVTPVAPSTTPSGTLTDTGSTGQTGQTSYCTTSPNVTYTSTVTGTITSPLTDTITVMASPYFYCPYSNPGPSGSAQITTNSTAIAVTPTTSVIQQGSSVPLTAKLPSALSPAGYSYMWTLTPAAGASLAGTLTDSGGTGHSMLTSYCSTSNLAVYVSNAMPAITLPQTDTVMVTAFAGGGCVQANQLAATSLPATVTVQAKPTLVPIPDYVDQVFQASDGNLYVRAPLVYKIYKIDRSLNVSVLLDYSGVVDPNGNSISEGGPLTLGPDGAFYGVTANGYLFKISLGGQLTGLTQLLSAANAQYGGNYVFLGADGNFYDSDGRTRITPSGQATAFATEAGTVSDPSENNLVQASDGNFYGVVYQVGVSGPNAPPSSFFYIDGGIGQISPSGISSPFLGFPYNGDSLYTITYPSIGPPISAYTSTNLTEGPDGGLYGLSPTVGAGTLPDPSTQGLALFEVSLGGSLTVKSESLALGTLGSLVAGPDGNFYANYVAQDLIYGGSGHTVVGSNGINASGVAQVTPAGTVTNLINVVSSQVYDSNSGPGFTDTGAMIGTIQPVTSQGVGPSSGTGGVFILPFFPNGPVQLTLSAPTVTAGSPVTLNWNVTNAFSLTAQQCYAFVQNNAAGAGTWTGQQLGTVSSSGYSGSATITPTAPGTYTYALTCGGVESGFATLQVQ